LDAGLWFGISGSETDRNVTSLNTVMNLQVPWNERNFSANLETTSFSRTMLHGVQYLDCKAKGMELAQDHEEWCALVHTACNHSVLCLKMSWQAEHGKIKCKPREIITWQWRQFLASAYFGGLLLYSIQSVMSYFVHYTISAVEPNVYKDRRQREGGNDFELSVFHWIIKTIF